MAFNNKKYMKEWRNNNKEKIAAYQKEYMKEYNRQYYQKKKELGLCPRCGKQHHFRLVRCLECHRDGIKKYHEYVKRHPNRFRERSDRWRKLYKETGRCTSCGHTLNPDMDNGRVKCLNCREEIHTPRRQHGNIIF